MPQWQTNFDVRRGSRWGIRTWMPNAFHICIHGDPDLCILRKAAEESNSSQRIVCCRWIHPFETVLCGPSGCWTDSSKMICTSSSVRDENAKDQKQPRRTFHKQAQKETCIAICSAESNRETYQKAEHGGNNVKKNCSRCRHLTNSAS